MALWVFARRWPARIDEVHVVDGGHFVPGTATDEIAELIGRRNLWSNYGPTIVPSALNAPLEAIRVA